ncbi:peptidoglycan glycosyltransferase OS=Streptomyces violarus OX=67380 GN=FHS41_004734 PE=4 SV=1 [Streptomyces violarus]
MISDIGICPVTTMAKKMGVVRADGNKMPQVPSIALGTREMAPLTMANAYATFASRGMHCTPVAIESVTQRVRDQRKSLQVPKSTCSRAMSEKTADTINALLRGVVEDGTGKKAGLDSRPSAGKTGTTDERYAAWFVGYTPNMAGAVWVGDPAHKRKMTNITIGGRSYGKVFGGEVPGPIWGDMMNGALQGKPVEQFNTVHIPDGIDRDRGDGDDEGRGDGDDGDNGNGNGFIGGLVGGNNGGGGDDPFPTPSFSIPEGFFRGQDNGGGNGNGGRFG